jgi:hypothetical protein
MAPMLAMIAEMQKELRELRSRRSSNSSSSGEDSDDDQDESGNGPREFAGVLSMTELAARTYQNLQPAVCHDARFRSALDYCYYRLSTRSVRYDAQIASRVARWTQQMEASFKLRFDGSDSLAILQFLKAFVEAADNKGIREGAALHVLRSFLDSPAREEFTAFRAQAFPVAVDWLLSTFAPASSLAIEYKAICSMNQHNEESPREFSLRLRQRAS